MEEMPDLDIAYVTLRLDRQTGRVEVDYQGMNYLEAIGVITVGLHQVEDTPIFLEWEMDDEDD